MDNAQATAWLCENMDLLAARAGQDQATAAELEKLRADAAAGRDITAGTDDLRRRLALPAPGQVRSLTYLTEIPGLGTGGPVVEVYGCPAGACTRRWVRQPATDPPRCALLNAPLRPPDTT